MHEIYRIGDPKLALEWVEELPATLNDSTYCTEIRRIGRMLARWAPQIAAWHRSRASNGPVEAINNLAKRVKRVAVGHRPGVSVADGLRRLLRPAGRARRHLPDRWCRGTIRSRVQPIKAFVRMVRSHGDGVLRRHQTRSSNGTLEGPNSLVQAAKRKARGYRS